MAAAGESEADEENILYDLLINTEWPPETDTQLRGLKERSPSVLAKAVTGPFRFILHYLWYSPSSATLPAALVRLTSKQTNWHVMLGSNGKLLAVVQDQCVEIRSARDDFGSVIGKCQVPKDPLPQWRRVAWSADCALLAYSESTGTVRVFDLMGSELFIIPPAVSFPGDLSYAAAALMFLDYTASAQWSAELLVITYSGQLRSYLVSVGTNQSFQENHSYSFPSPISSAVYHPAHRLLLVGGCECGDERLGITAWRVLSGSPHYKQATGCEDHTSASPRRGFLKMPSFRLFSRLDQEKDGVFRMSLSPDGTVLAAVHLSGALSLWDVPSMRLRGRWRQEEQPGYDEINPEWKTSLEKRKKIKDKEQYQCLLEVSWWSESAVILARCSGALTVSSVHTLHNLLGSSCEWFQPAPRLTPAHQGGFLSLECEVKLAHKRPRVESSVSTEGDGEDDSDSEDEASAKTRYCSYVKRGLYYVTEMERFAPLRKRPRSVIKSYRLVSLRSTTPEELYQRKIDSEEYGEALSLARAYGLDSDLVYQRQWRKSTVSIASIQDYLSKIKKRSWVLHECVERVPENVDAAEELLQYGLKGTDLEALISIGDGGDRGRFILPGDVDVDDAPYEDFLSAEEEVEQRKAREAERRRQLLKKVEFSRLNLEQKELCRNRLKLLCYLDRLATYEEILGGPHAAEMRFDGDFFKKFRNQNLLLSARTYARESNVQALDILFSYHGSELLPHRLALLCNFPETTSPHEYTDLLPKARLDKKGQLGLVPWEETRHRDLDWCEAPDCRASVLPDPEDDCSFLYEEQPELRRFCSATPSIALLTDWYLSRAQDIESHSRQVDCSLSLVRLGREQNVPGLELLCDDLVTMETLVYEASCDLSLTLKELQQLKDIDKLRLLMKNSSEETYVRDCFQWMVPFLQRCESRRTSSAFSLVTEYLLSLASEDLTLPLRLFQHSKPHCHPKIISDADQLMRVALACVYQCERDDQLALCYDLLECLPQRGYGLETNDTEALHDQVDRLEKHLSVAEVLEKHGLQKPIMFVRSCENSVEEAHQLMVRLTRHTGRKNPPVSESVWRDLLQDLLDMQKNVYTCLEPESCHQVFVESLLCSGREENVRLAGQLMHRSALSEDTPISAPFRLSYRRSVELVQAAAREYFDSSATLSDPCMDLARSCLLLITDCPPLIQEELDLISALSLLEQLGVKVLPLQVRLRADRLSLIKECVSMSPTAYRQPSLLLGVAALLRVSGDDEAERKGRVLTLLAEQALHAQDFTASYAHCEELMSAGYSEGWSVCASLGVCEVLSPLAARQRLLAFSLTHCPASFIQDLLVSSSSLQTQVLYQAVNYQIDPAAASQTGNAAPASINPTDLLHRTTRAALYSLGDAHWWKESLSLLRPLHGAARTRVSSANHSAALERQGCGPFYQDLFRDPLISPTQEVYSSYDYTPGEQVAEVLLRTVSVTQTSSEGRSPCPVTEVLLELACDAVVSDVALALAYLLALPRACEADRCFQKKPPSALWLQFAVYYYCLQIYSRLTPCVTDQCSPAYRADPRELIGLVTKHVSDHAGADWADEELKTLIGRLRLYSERLTDFTQAQVLQGLGRGVDVQRFSNDPQYKKETILGLAETLDEKVYGISRSLAQRYSIPLWDVHMTHLEFLFTDSGLSVRDVESRCDALGLMATLRSDPEAFHAHMTRYVWPSLEGEDQPVLLLYFTLLESCGCGLFFPADAVKPDTHLKLLKKLRAVAAGLDYKKLMGGACDPLEALEPVLTSQNVLSVSKLAALIPRPEGDALTPSAVHATWLRKLFWTGDPHVMKKRPHTDQDFLLAYDACARHLHRLMPADLLRFLNAVTFTPEAASRLSVEARLEISRRAQVALKGLREKSRKRAGEEKSDLYDLSLSHVEQSIAHLETLSQHFPVSLLTSPEERLRAYGRAYDLSRSEPSELRRLGVTMAMEGVAVARVRELLAVAVCSRELTAQSVMRDAVQRILAALSGDTPALELGAEPLKLLEGLVSAVQEDVLSGGDTVTSEDLLAWLRPFCGDDSKAVCLRMDVLQMLEQRFSLVEQDLQMLLLYRSQALLKPCWPHRECEMIHVQGEQERYTLFLELLESSRKWEEFQHLMMLLQAWPPIRDQTRLQADQNPWVGVASAVLAHCSGSAHIDPGAEVLAMCRSLYPTPHKLQPQCVERVSRALLDAGLKLCALKLLMESEEESLHTLALDHLSSITQVTSEVCDAELMSALLDAGLLLECVDTPFYAPLSAHMLALGRWDTEGAVRALQGAGRGVQAGSLLLSARGTHPAHVTFSTALAALRKWI